MTNTATAPAKTNAEIVLSAVQDLFAREQIVTRETLVELSVSKRYSATPGVMVEVRPA